VIWIAQLESCKVCLNMDNVRTRQILTTSQDSLAELKKQSLMFEQSTMKLGERDKVLYDMIEKALRRKDNLRANMFANELTKVRHLKRMFSQSHLVIECITIRMESLLDLYNAIQLEPVSQAIKEVMGEVQGISPEFVSGLEKLTMLASDTLKESTIGFKQQALEEVFKASSPESLEILNEVSRVIADCLQESFPEPPIRGAQATVEKSVEAIAYGYEPQLPSRKAAVVDNSNDLGLLSDDVVKILNSFTAQSKLKIEDTAT
jgi:division protein CdvB (Snf7/Vps24/ESCRT-III family)